MKRLQPRYQQTNIIIEKKIWRVFKGNVHSAGRHIQPVIEEMLQSANEIHWQDISPKARLKVVIVEPPGAGQETEGLGEK